MIKLAKSNYEQYKTNAQENVANYWNEIAKTYQWHQVWDNTVKADFYKPDVKWFLNGKLNITENCLDRHLATQADKTAIIWEPNNPADEAKHISYKQLHEQVCKMANVFKQKGIKKGDRVCFYMPMIPELAVGVLACARIGAIHSVVFAGFSAKSLADRINDANCKLVVCSDEAYRGAKTIPIKSVVDEALRNCPTVEAVLLKQHSYCSLDMGAMDCLLDDLMDKTSTDCQAEIMDAEAPLFILYTSGSTGKPKGIVHTTAGYMVYAGYSFQQVFQYEKGDVYWCTADIGWITGHSYIVYGPLLMGATTIMFEGVPTWPDASRFWQIVEKFRVNQFYTAPTAIRALMAKGDQFTEQADLGSLKVIGSVGEPINDEAWHWYNEKIGKKKCPIVDTWWQTETGGILIAPLPNINEQIPCFATKPLPGIEACLVDENGNEMEEMEAEGLLCIKHPWPSMLRTIYADHERCRKTYFSMFPGYYFTGDGAKRDKNGNYRIIGRVDDVINVSGHRLGTAEVENAINQHEQVIESAVVGYPHDIKGQGIYAYVITDGQQNELIEVEIIATVNKEIGPIAKPDKIQLVSGLPKTRSGKIMRRILRKIAVGESNFGDTSTLLDPTVVEQIQAAKK